MKLSIVSPVYQAEKIISTLVDRIEKSVQKITTDYEIILGEDGGPDNSWEVIEKTCSQNTKITGIQLSRNFGQHNAIICGVEQTFGEFIITMDEDLQHGPKDIEGLIEKQKEGGFHA